jgi:predicted nucleic acid-binding protein
LLLDTDVLIDYLRGQANAVSFISGAGWSLQISSVTVAELYVGVREGTERKCLERLISVLEVIDITPAIATQAGLWRRDYGKSHGTGLMDALTAATAYHTGGTLVTLNAKHFPMLKSVRVPYQKN